jgi:hypothetical protein
MTDASTLFDLLTSDVRRRLLVALCDRDSVRIPDELLTRGQTEAVAAQSGHDGLTEATLHRQTTQLYHVHLPKMADTDVIEWDEEAATVSRGPAFEAVEPAVRLLVANAHELPGEFY